METSEGGRGIDIKATTHETADITSASKSRVCVVCTRNISKYTCPRCNIPYCSISCYKNHSQQCVAQFNQAKVETHLKGQKASEEEIKEMKKILARQYQQMQNEGINESEENIEIDEEADSEDLQKLLALQMKENLSVSDLTEEDRKLFLRSAADGSLSKLINVWKPWWKVDPSIVPPKSAKPLITEVSQTNSATPQTSQEEFTGTIEISHVPVEHIPKDIPSINQLTPVTPSPLLKYNLLDILYSYGYVYRLYNGEPQIESEKACGVVLEISNVLSGAQKSAYPNVSSAFDQVIQNSLKPSVRNSVGFSRSIVEDVKDILSHKEWILASLSQLNILFLDSAQSFLQHKSPQEKKPIKEISLAQKKIFFYISWANEQEQVVFTQLKEQVVAITHSSQFAKTGAVKPFTNSPTYVS